MKNFELPVFAVLSLGLWSSVGCSVLRLDAVSRDDGEARDRETRERVAQELAEIPSEARGVFGATLDEVWEAAHRALLVLSFDPPQEGELSAEQGHLACGDLIVQLERHAGDWVAVSVSGAPDVPTDTAAQAGAAEADEADTYRRSRLLLEEIERQLSASDEIDAWAEKVEALTEDAADPAGVAEIQR